MNCEFADCPHPMDPLSQYGWCEGHEEENIKYLRSPQEERIHSRRIRRRVVKVGRCASCRKDLSLVGRGLCRGCHVSHRLADTLHLFPATRKFGLAEKECAECGEVAVLKTMRLCSKCYDHERYEKGKATA